MKDRKTSERRSVPTWWISLSYGHGKRLRMSSHSDKRADAVKLLRQKLAQFGSRTPDRAGRRPHDLRGPVHRHP
jgi:hypothetical protein